MPKKTFRSNNSTVLIKRSKFAAITRSKVINSRSKLILIDERNENNWKFLKSELGYKTDSLFLEYLLNLAQRDLNLFRSKNLQISNVTGKTLNTLDCNNDVNNDGSSSLQGHTKVPSQNSCSSMEKEKKREIHTFCNKNEISRSQSCIQVAKETSLGKIGEGVPKDFKEYKRGTGYCDFNSLRLTTSAVKFKKDNTKNSKTESVKNIELDSTLIISSKAKSEEESQTFGLLNSYNYLDKGLGAVKKASSFKTDDDYRVVESDKMNHKVLNSNAPQDNISDGIVKKNEMDSRSSTENEINATVDTGVNLMLGSGENNSRAGIKIKLCILCNRRHVAGRCSIDTCNPIDVDKKNDRISNNKSESDSILGKIYNDSYVLINKKTDCGNIYDFDDNEKEMNMEVNSRWRHKLLKVNDLIECSSQNSHVKEKIASNDDENDSDSSNFDLKLRIDENLGQNPSFAESSLPDHFTLKIVDNQHGQSVFTKSLIPKSTLVGPLLGKTMKEMDIPDDFDMKFIWEVNTSNGVVYISTKDPETSNWLRFLRPATSREAANLVSTVKDNGLYFTSTKDISKGDELVYWMDDIHSAWSKKKLEKKNCGGCNIQFKHPLYYRKHCMIFHDPTCSLTIRKYHCKICGLAVLGKEKIMKHAAEMHQGKGAYQCQYCHKFFLRLNYLEMHRTYGCSKNPQRSRPLCDLCGRKFCQPQKLKVHIKRMHSDMAQVLKDFQCKSCLKILGSRAALQRHMKEVHNKDIIGACTCDRCGKMFQNKSNLKIHMLTHSGVKPFKCQETDCTAAFTTKQCLQFHYKKVHGFTDDIIPKIERSIAYTFDAYSGGIVSETTRGQLPRVEEHLNSMPEQRECGLDLSLVTPFTENSRGKEKIPDPLSKSSDQKSMQQSDNRYADKEETVDRSPEYGSVKLEEDRKLNSLVQDSSSETYQVNKIMVSKGSKKWLGSEPANDKSDERFKSIFRRENANATLLVEAAISAAEKDIIVKPSQKSPGVNHESVESNPSEVYSINQYVVSSPGTIYDSGEKKLDEYGRISMDSQKFEEVENKKGFSESEKTTFNDFIRCSTLLRINTSPVSEMPKDYNISSIIRDQEAESFADIEIQDYRNRDFLETYKDGESFPEPYRAHELYRSEKFDLYRGGETDFRMSAFDKIEYRDFDLSNETYRNLATNLEKYRSADLYRLRGEGYELGVGYRDLSDERDGEAQNLCLKEKSFQYETLEELARIGRDNPGFECLLVGDAGSALGNQNFAAGAPRGLHGMLSPRSYHPTYESESVDLSVPRPAYSSSPVYTLDLTPTRVELPTRHLDFRSHLGLTSHRFPNSRLPCLGSGTSQVSPNGYSVYSSPYVTPGSRHSPSSQFQPYTSLYY